MKLLFPAGEHEQVRLQGESLRIGSGKDCDIRITADGVALHHLLLRQDQGDWWAEVDDPDKVVEINGTRVREREKIKPGDAILLSSVRIRVVASVDHAPQSATRSDIVQEDDGRTRVRQALPRFSLRGVSGEVFGKTIPLHGKTVIGRQQGCDVVLADPAISREHVRITVYPDGVKVEDLGSANGTFINGKRIAEGWLEDGDELKLDTMRFLFQAPPGLKMQQTRRHEPVSVEQEADGGGRALIGAITVLVGLILAVAGWYFLSR